MRMTSSPFMPPFGSVSSSLVGHVSQRGYNIMHRGILPLVINSSRHTYPAGRSHTEIPSASVPHIVSNSDPDH